MIGRLFIKKSLIIGCMIVVNHLSSTVVNKYFSFYSLCRRYFMNPRLNILSDGLNIRFFILHYRFYSSAHRFKHTGQELHYVDLHCDWLVQKLQISFRLPFYIKDHSSWCSQIVNVAHFLELKYSFFAGVNFVRVLNLNALRAAKKLSTLNVTVFRRFHLLPSVLFGESLMNSHIKWVEKIL